MAIFQGFSMGFSKRPGSSEPHRTWPQPGLPRPLRCQLPWWCLLPWRPGFGREFPSDFWKLNETSTENPSFFDGKSMNIIISRSICRFFWSVLNTLRWKIGNSSLLDDLPLKMLLFHTKLLDSRVQPSTKHEKWELAIFRTSIVHKSPGALWASNYREMRSDHSW